MTPDTLLANRESARATQARVEQLVLDYYLRNTRAVEVVIVAADGSAETTLQVDVAEFCRLV